MRKLFILTFFLLLLLGNITSYFYILGNIRGLFLNLLTISLIFLNCWRFIAQTNGRTFFLLLHCLHLQQVDSNSWFGYTFILLISFRDWIYLWLTSLIYSIVMSIFMNVLCQEVILLWKHSKSNVSLKLLNTKHMSKEYLRTKFKKKLKPVEIFSRCCIDFFVNLLKML